MALTYHHLLRAGQNLGQEAKSIYITWQFVGVIESIQILGHVVGGSLHIFAQVSQIRVGLVTDTLQWAALGGRAPTGASPGHTPKTGTVPNRPIGPKKCYISDSSEGSGTEPQEGKAATRRGEKETKEKKQHLT